jgi:hypothetical protein
MPRVWTPTDVSIAPNEIRRTLHKISTNVTILRKAMKSHILIGEFCRKSLVIRESRKCPNITKQETKRRNPENSPEVFSYFNFGKQRATPTSHHSPGFRNSIPGPVEDHAHAFVIASLSQAFFLGDT